ncbi:peptidoglycan DD-metalloendopeptidase family protein, partial [Chloroflexota bacterium]
DADSQSDIFVFDRETNQITLVSNVGSTLVVGSSISADGHYVAFEAYPSWMGQIYVYDTQTGQTTPISVSSGGELGNDNSGLPTISADGRFVAFESLASNLVSGDTANTFDVFIHDRQTGQTTRITHETSTGGNIVLPAISADGRFVTFHSTESDLVSGDTNNDMDVFVYERQTGQITWVSIASDGTQGNDWSGVPAISSDGRYVAFLSLATNLVSGDTPDTWDVFIHDRQTHTTTRITNDSITSIYLGEPHISISAEGRYVAYRSASQGQVFVYDQKTAQTALISAAPDGTPGNGDSSEGPSISADGRYVAFPSSATNLVVNDTNGFSDIFVHDQGPPTYSISGQATDVSNNPIPNVIISASGGYTTTTDGNGNYTFNGLMIGTYSFTASHSSYAFIPEIRTTSVPPSATGQDFGGSRAPCTNGLATADTNYCAWPQFLDLPIDYDGTRSSFVLALQNWDYLKDVNSGRINSWFDHMYPDRWYENSQDRQGDNSSSIWLYNRIVNDPDTYYWSGGPCFENRCYSGHGGIDFRCLKHPDTNDCVKDDSKQIIRSTAPGTVVKVQSIDNNAGYGKYIVVDHHNNYFTLYGHLKEISTWITEDADVIQGQPIGIMGNTGNGNGTHLHFGVYINENEQGWDGATRIDPYGWKQDKTDPWWPHPSSYLWLYDPEIRMSFLADQGVTFNDNTDLIEVSVSPDTFTGDVTLELSPGPVAGASAELRNAGVSFWLILREWLPETTQSSNISATQVNVQALTKPITLTVAYSDFGTRHFNTSQLGLYYWDEISRTWQILPGSRDEINQKMIAQTRQLGDFSIQAPLICPADYLELNDDFYTASPMPLPDSPIDVLFDIFTDEDWFWLDATGGFTYTLQTANLAAGVDTIIEIYDIDGITSLASDDNSGDGLASMLEWVAPQDGTYYVRVGQAPGSTFGCNASYELMTQVEGMKSIYLPIILKQ